jgi:hypothetical protein
MAERNPGLSCSLAASSQCPDNSGQCGLCAFFRPFSFSFSFSFIFFYFGFFWILVLNFLKRRNNASTSELNKKLIPIQPSDKNKPQSRHIHSLGAK